MKQTLAYCIPATATILMLALFASDNVQGAAKDSANKTGAKVLSGIRSVPEVVPPQSVFVIPSQPSEGRNPFFPQSTTQVVVAKVTRENPVETFSFVLNGITSPPKRTAMINGRTFETGEEGEVRLPSGGKILIKCEEIKAESAMILVGGQRRELRLRSGL